MKTNTYKGDFKGSRIKRDDLLSYAETLDTQLSMKAEELKQSEAGRWRLLLQLHEVQEALEQRILENLRLDNLNHTLHTRLSTLLEQQPQFWEYESLDLNYTPEEFSVEWMFTNVNIAGRVIPRLVFKTVKQNGATGIVFPALGSKESFSFIKKPYHLNKADLVNLSPQPGPLLQGNNGTLTILGTTDWESLVSLAEKLRHQTNNKIIALKAPGLDCADLENGLFNLFTTLSNWPAVLRYDSIKLKGVRNEGDYHSISIQMTNISFGEHRWRDVSYTLSTVAENGVFGKNPRIEFPEQTRSALVNWYPETSDHRGSRLELRFSTPNLMDIPVWQALAEKDQCLISALIAFLPIQFSELRSNTNIVRKWDDWSGVAKSMKDILAYHVNT